RGQSARRLGVAGGSSHFGSEVLGLLFDAFANNVQGEAIHLGVVFLEHLLNALLVVLHEGLRQQSDFLQILLNGAFHHLCHDLGRLAGFSSLLFGNGAFAIDVFGRHAVGGQGLGLGSRNVHGDVLADFFGTGQVDQHTNAPAVNVARQTVSGFEALEATHRHVFADLTHQGGTDAFHSAVTEGQLAQGRNVGGGLLGDQACQIVHEGDEVVVLGYEVGLAVDFDHSAGLAVVGNVQADQALGGHTRGGLAGLIAKLDAQNFLGAGQVAVCFGQRFLAFHHGRVGLLAQFLDHACSDLGHNFLQFGKTRPGRDRGRFEASSAPATRGGAGNLEIPVPAAYSRPSSVSASTSTSTNSSSSASSSTMPLS